MTTIARMNQTDTSTGESSVTLSKGHSVTKLNTKNVVLYALHRNEVMFLNGGSYLLELESEQTRSTSPAVVVKGRGFCGIGKSIKAWTLALFSGHRSKRGSSKRSNRVTSDSRP